jgi:hypothetical protein
VNASFKDDVTVILHLGVSLAVAFNEAPAKRIEEAYRAGRLCIFHFEVDY